MILVLAESALELIPREIWGHPAVRADAQRRGKRPGEIILDRARHHPAMATLADGKKRGRPDIVHQTLLAFQYSPLALSGRGRAVVHTRDDHVIHVNPAARIPKNYNNFISLVEQLYALGKVPPRGEALLRLERRNLASLLEELGGRWVVLHEEGRRIPLVELGGILKDAVVVVGGFPHGDFQNRWVVEKAAGVYRVGDKPLDAFQAVCKALSAVEYALGLV